MPLSSGLSQPALSSSKLAAPDGLSWRMWSGLAGALVLHLVLLLVAYLRPPPPAPRKRQPIQVDVVVRRRPPPPPVQPPPPPKQQPLPPSRVSQPPSRPLPRELFPVPRDPRSKEDAQSPAIEVPVPPPTPPEPGPAPKGPINLFPKSLAGVVGGPGINAPVPRGPDRLVKDERLDEKKAPDFELVPEKGGGFKYEGKNFIAHIRPDGALEFDNRFPVGFQRGGTFTFDITDLAMRGKGQDPYAAEKRRFAEWSEKTRQELRRKSIAEQHERALAGLSEQLNALWQGARSAAARRREIYDLWRDCSDDKGDKIGRQSRRIIEDFIRSNLPEGSADAYTEEELQRINNERQGLPPFNPYRTAAKF